jgi:hypothetical protein
VTRHVTADEPADNPERDTMMDPRDVFDRDALARICELRENEFQDAFQMNRHRVAQPVPDDFYLFRDNGSRILAVAHLDTVGRAHQRSARFVETEAGLVVYSRALDDRLGAYIILDMLPKLGVEVDVLLTVGEESGRSTAAFFDPPKAYDWMIEFDRGGTDVVMYQYDDMDTRALVKECGAVVGNGIFSDISYLEHLGIKGFNWGVGYQDYHGPRAHAYLDDTLGMVDKFLTFHELNADTYMPHEARGLFAEHRMTPDEDEPDYPGWWRSSGEYHGFNDDEPLDESDPFFWAEECRI